LHKYGTRGSGPSTIKPPDSYEEMLVILKQHQVDPETLLALLISDHTIDNRPIMPMGLDTKMTTWGQLRQSHYGLVETAVGQAIPNPSTVMQLARELATTQLSEMGHPQAQPGPTGVAGFVRRGSLNRVLRLTQPMTPAQEIRGN
jgi:hypothetical protein